MQPIVLFPTLFVFVLLPGVRPIAYDQFLLFVSRMGELIVNVLLVFVFIKSLPLL